MSTQALSFTRGLKVQIRVIYGIMVRDLMLRYGRDNLGFLWVFIEPMLLCIGVLIIYSLLRGDEHGVAVVALTLSGYMPLTLWRHLTNNAVNLYRRSTSVLYHRVITLYDMFFARMIMEFAGSTCAFLVIYLTLLSFGLTEPIRDPGLLIAGWFFLGLYGVSVAIIFAAMTEYWEVAEKFMGPFQYLTVPLSGAFFLVDWLPRPAQDAIWFNPLTHCFEMIRAGYFGDEIVTHYDLWYPAIWVIPNLYIGLRWTQSARARIHL